MLKQIVTSLIIDFLIHATLTLVNPQRVDKVVNFCTTQSYKNQMPNALYKLYLP